MYLFLHSCSCVAGVRRGTELWVQNSTFQTTFPVQMTVAGILSRFFFLFFFSKFLHCLHFPVLRLVCAVLIWASATLIISMDQTGPVYLLIFSFCSLDFIMSLFDMSIIVCLLGLSYFSCGPAVEEDPFSFGNDMFLLLFCLSTLRSVLWDFCSCNLISNHNFHADYYRLRVGGLILAAVLCLIGITILLSKANMSHTCECMHNLESMWLRCNLEKKDLNAKK